MTNKMRLIVVILFIIVGSTLFHNCKDRTATVPATEGNSLPSFSIIPDGIDSALVAQLTERLETEHFIFHYEPGDIVWAERSEAFHIWAVEYLGVTLRKKIDYYKFRTTDDMYKAVDRQTNGVAFPKECALATIYSWHNHESFHIYNSLYSDVPTIRLYEEGMVVAHEYDPYNNDFISQWNRRELDEPYIYSQKVLEFLDAGELYPIEEILESAAFNEAFQTGAMVLYVEAGMFVSYLIKTYGLDKMKEVFCSVTYDDTKETIMAKFEEVFRTGIQEVEAAWLTFLDSNRNIDQASKFIGTSKDKNSVSNFFRNEDDFYIREKNIQIQKKDNTLQNVYEETTLPSPCPPFMFLSKENIYFGGTPEGISTPGQYFHITNTVCETPCWTVEKDSDWLTCSPMSRIGDGKVSVSVDPSGHSPGIYTAAIRITSPDALNSPQYVNVTLNVYASGQESFPFGSFDTPADSTSEITGTIPLAGWALDDIGIDAVKIYREKDAGVDVPGSEDLVFLGEAALMEGARPDVEGVYSDYPLAYRAGWGYMLLTIKLPNQGNGQYWIHAFAYDIEGHRVSLGSKMICCNNAYAVKPFGMIDTHTQGEEVSGLFWSSGWTLTPLPNLIPRDGSTISIWVDGKNLGSPFYNQYRRDIESLFPWYANSSGAVGSFLLDTTLYSDGVHMIVWSVEDSGGNSNGIGSMYFTIKNSGGAATRFSALEWIKYKEDMSGRLMIDIEGELMLEIKELEQIEIRLNGKGGWHYIGWGENKSKPLPIGSTLDKEYGIFYWIPGAGFLRQHVLHFAVTDEEYMSKPIKIVVNIISENFNSRKAENGFPLQ